MADAERLRAAAEKIERVSARALEASGGHVNVADSESWDVMQRIWLWFALLGPDTGPALAKWLRDEAKDRLPWPSALAFADLILRDKP